MATKFPLGQIPDGVKIEQVTFKRLSEKITVISPEEVDKETMLIRGHVNVDEKKFKGKDNDYIQFNASEEDTAYDVFEKEQGDTVGYLLVTDGSLIAVDKPKAALLPIFILIGIIVAVLAIMLGVMFLGKGKSDVTENNDIASSATSDIKIAQGETFDGNIDNGKSEEETETRFIEFPAFTTVYVEPGTTIDLVNPESNHVYFKYTILENDEVLYESDYITPGQKLAWDATQYVTGAGQHNLTFSVSTIGVDDQQPRNGADFAVTAIVS